MKSSDQLHATDLDFSQGVVETSDSDLDSQEARAFVERAASHPSAAGSGDGRGGPPTAPARPTAVQKEMLRPLTLRIPDSLHARLLHIAENGSKSMNQFVIDALMPAVERQVEKIARRKELGLD